MKQITRKQLNALTYKKLSDLAYQFGALMPNMTKRELVDEVLHKFRQGGL